MGFCLIGVKKKEKKTKKIDAQKLQDANERAQKASLGVSRQPLICIDFVLFNYSGVFVISLCKALCVAASHTHVRACLQTNRNLVCCWLLFTHSWGVRERQIEVKRRASWWVNQSSSWSGSDDCGKRLQTVLMLRVSCPRVSFNVDLYSGRNYTQDEEKYWNESLGEETGVRDNERKAFKSSKTYT